MDKQIQRHSVSIIAKISWDSEHNEPGYYSGFKSVEQAMDYVDLYDSMGYDVIAVEENIKYTDGSETVNRIIV